MKICIDAGHGHKRGMHTGAQSTTNKIVEDDWALIFAQRLGHYLRAVGISTIFTRPDNYFVELKNRTHLARKEKCDAFISIHLNAGAIGANGCEAFYASGDERGKEFCNTLLKVLTDHGLKNRGSKPDNASQHSKLYVLRNTYQYMHSTLIEVGFLTNKYDSELLNSKTWVEETAMYMAKTIVEYLK